MKAFLTYCFVILAPPLLIALAFTGCQDSDRDHRDNDSRTNNPVLEHTNPSSSLAVPDADNSRRNVDDRDNSTMTPDDQGNSPADRTITQKIRQAVVSRSDYSTTAKNVKIITRDGRVTLRGPVETETEKAGISSDASNVVGPANVDSQLEVTANP